MESTQRQGAIGQAGADRLSAGSFTLDGGYWPAAARPWRLYMPLARR